MSEIVEGEVARYCKPSALDEKGSPTSAAFRRRPQRNEGYLSVYLLNFFGSSDQKDNMVQVKKEMESRNFKVKKSALFALLDIEQSKKYIMDEISEVITYKERNLPHVGIFHESDDLLIAELLAECVQGKYFAKDIMMMDS